jgi:hypothetical protein
MGRSFSLRGTITIADNAVTDPPQLIFSYEAPDRKKAWKITGAYTWCQSTDAEIGTSDLQGVATATLLTDTTNYTGGINDLSNVSDNRQCAWHQSHYMLRAGGTDFIVKNAQSPSSSAFIIDEDTIVVNQLHIAFGFRTESATSPSRDWNYLVTLEEVKLTAWESIFQQIKGMGQDVSN